MPVKLQNSGLETPLIIWLYNKKITLPIELNTTNHFKMIFPTILTPLQGRKLFNIYQKFEILILTKKIFMTQKHIFPFLSNFSI